MPVVVVAVLPIELALALGLGSWSKVLWLLNSDDWLGIIDPTIFDCGGLMAITDEVFLLLLLIATPVVVDDVEDDIV